MKHILPKTNWTTALAQLIEDCANGDTIEVSTQAAAELGERARQRMCPEKRITFVVADELSQTKDVVYRTLQADEEPEFEEYDDALNENGDPWPERDTLGVFDEPVHPFGHGE